MHASRASPFPRSVTKESSILIAIDGTEAGDKAFHYLLKSKVLSTNAHIFIVTILPANVLSGPWVSGPLSIDTKRQNEMLKALREQALQKLTPYRDQLREAGYETVSCAPCACCSESSPY